MSRPSTFRQQPFAAAAVAVAAESAPRQSSSARHTSQCAAASRWPPPAGRTAAESGLTSGSIPISRGPAGAGSSWNLASGSAAGSETVVAGLGAAAAVAIGAAGIAWKHNLGRRRG